jgi:hypothetical protein
MLNDPFQMDEEMNHDNFDNNSIAFNSKKNKSTAKDADSSEEDLDLNVILKTIKCPYSYQWLYFYLQTFQMKKSSVKGVKEADETSESLSAFEKLRVILNKNMSRLCPTV